MMKLEELNVKMKEVIVDHDRLNRIFLYSLKKNPIVTFKVLKRRIELLYEIKDFWTVQDKEQLKWSEETLNKYKHLLPFI